MNHSMEKKRYSFIGIITPNKAFAAERKKRRSRKRGVSTHEQI